MARPKSISPVIVATSFVLDPASIASATANEITQTVNGLTLGFPVTVWGPSLEANVSITNAYCSAANTLVFRLSNPTVGAIDPASQTFYVVQR
jgi:hypothetical protein